MNKSGVLLKKIKSKLVETRGFTFAELLVAVLIMLLATGTLTAAMSLAIRHFYKSTQKSEAQILCGSLAEFVEDELSFSTVKITGSDISISKGTHNMGSDISFYVNTTGDTYTAVDATTVGTYGKLTISGDNFTGQYFKLTTDGAYDVGDNKGYSLAAGMSLAWDNTNKWFNVEIRVVDKSESDILSNVQFTVKPLIVK
ncbi:MAG: hypothetical protein K6F37_09245 [Lachnospiraceae bacterium]|nr:hypothetical protein [Lachnospiraceae bacterium]